jgi:hypothetical protein
VSGSKEAHIDWLIQEEKVNNSYILIALAALLRLAREANVTENEIQQLVFSSAENLSETEINDLVSEKSLGAFVPKSVLIEKVDEFSGSQEVLSTNPVVTKVGVESAHFSNGITILRQRPYLNINFAGLRNAHDILQSDTFRSVFQVGRTLSETQKLFANPEDIQVDGDPGDARKRVLKP